ncbi:tRNA (adenosine(37)-N6)-dimethylallyltransferase MiaA [Acetonema longum]|uniref:tRNA (adenosine(37)-N6)-dimethylallyltransferase MiaA n=1 Tax=Acetonema longum TaxID=2374 RepID=UPI00058D4464
MDRLIVVIGPTAVGKTRLGIDLAQLLQTQIISGDSMLIYRGMDVGTAKPDLKERQGITHHMIDILEPTEDFSVAQFQSMAGEIIHSINQQGMIPILVGGTGLYVKALLEGFTFNQAVGDHELRSRLAKLAETQGNQYLHDLLSEVDPYTAQRLHPNDLRRVTRALEVHYTAGEQLSEQKQATGNKHLFDCMVIGLSLRRDVLYDKINRRVDLMLQNGLVEEVFNLLARGVPPGAQSLQAIGYKEIVAYLAGQTDLPTAIGQIKQSTRHFAKRQMTWFRKMPYIEWFSLDQHDYAVMLTRIHKRILEKFPVG